MPLAEKIKSARASLGWNQKRLADAAGISQATISRAEAGQVKQLKSEALKQIASALGITVDYLVDQTDELTLTGAVQADPTVQEIFHAYERLSGQNRELLKNFVEMLLRLQRAQEEATMAVEPKPQPARRPKRMIKLDE